MSVIQNENGKWDVYDDYWWSVKHRNSPTKEEAQRLEKLHCTPLTDEERFIMQVLKPLE